MDSSPLTNSELAVNATNPTEVPLPGLQYPEDIAVTADGAIHVTNGSHTELQPSGIAVDTSGAVYITVINGTVSDGGQVLRLAES